MSYELGHKLYTVTIKFVAADGMNGKVLEEIKDLRLRVEGNDLSGKESCLDHASEIRFNVTHENL